LEQVGSEADVLVIDSPPVMAVTDSVVLAPRVDGVLVVIRPGSTNLAASKQAVEQLRRVGARLLGVVLNEVDVSGSRYKYYRYKGYYYSYHYYNYDDQTPSKRFPKNGFHLRKEKVESENKIN
jgi:Mrp family chromosome partitioning ATPase